MTSATHNGGTYSKSDCGAANRVSSSGDQPMHFFLSKSTMVRKITTVAQDAMSAVFIGTCSV